MMCAIPGCGRKVHARGLCVTHWRRDQAGKPMSTPFKARNGDWLAYADSLIGTDEQDCIFWPFGNSGLPSVTLDGKKMLATRYLCAKRHGEPKPGDEAAHSCGKGHLRCVNPNHLRWATHAENEADKLLHGTRHQGSRMYNSKLSDESVRLIRELASRGSLITHLAEDYGVSHSLISEIVSRKRWKHLA